MEKIVRNLCIICATLSIGKCHAVNFRHLTNENGISYSAVADITQDRLGYIWIATTKGLNRYDSYSVVKYYCTPNDSLSLPSNKINCLLPDNTDNIIIGTENGLCLRDSRSEQFHRIEPEGCSMGRINDLASLGENRTVIATATALWIMGEDRQPSKLDTLGVDRLDTDNEGIIWCCNSHSVYTYSADGSCIDRYSAAEICGDIAANISALFVDGHNNIWIGTINHQLYRFNVSRHRFEQIRISNDKSILRYIRDIGEDQYGRLWIATENGIVVYNHSESDYSHYTQSIPKGAQTINDNATYCIFRSRENIMWIGTYFGGVNYVLPNDGIFVNTLPDDTDRSISGKAVSEITTDSRGRLWIGSEDRGISVYDRLCGRYTYYNKHSGISGDNIHAIAEDTEGNMWVGTYIDGLNRISKDGRRVDSFTHSDNDPHSICDNSVYKIYIRNADSIFVGTLSGVDLYHPSTGKFSHFNAQLFTDKRFDDIFADRANNIWFCSYEQGVYRYNTATGRTSAFRSEKYAERGLISDNILCGMCDSRGEIWLGTRNGGLLRYNPESDSFTMYGLEQRFDFLDIYAILEDNMGNLWFSTNDGLYTMNIDSGRIKRYDKSYGLPTNQFNFNSAFRAMDGTMYFGTIDGMTSFNSNYLKLDTTQPEIHFTGLNIFNRHISPDRRKGSPLAESIDFADRITLRHNQSSVSFDFIAMNYLPYTIYDCYYKLEGFDSQWQRAKHKSCVASYTNLFPGKYTFTVRITDDDGKPISSRSIALRIRKSPFKTDAAIIFYALCLAAIAFWLIRQYNTRREQKVAIEIEKAEKENIKALNRHKISFFTYISHEFKTPLTIIMTLLDDIAEQRQQAVSSKMNIIKSNIGRLQKLISQLMEFQTVESQYSQLSINYVDIIALPQHLFELFIPLFRQKGLQYDFASAETSRVVAADGDKIETIISNLLSNALKSVAQGGNIALSVGYHVDRAVATFVLQYDVESGATEHIDRLNNYYRDGELIAIQDNMELAVAESLTKYIGGTMEIEAQSSNTVLVRIELPAITDNTELPTFSTSLNEERIQGIYDDILYSTVRYEPESELPGDNKHEYVVLVIESNRDLRHLLKERLSKYYRVKTSDTCLNALEIIRETNPDIIISEAQTESKFDCFQLCISIKQSERTNHIPIVLISSSEEHKQRGLDMGIYAYIVKPFAFDELLMVVHNFIQTKNAIRKNTSTLTVADNDREITNRDEDFIQKFTRLVVDNISDNTLPVSYFAQHLSMSRTTLYTKLKHLTGLTTTEFVNAIKIDEAKKLLRTSELTIAEISYRTGFSSSNYFCKTFKRQTSQTPYEYRKGSQP